MPFNQKKKKEFCAQICIGHFVWRHDIFEVMEIKNWTLVQNLSGEEAQKVSSPLDFVLAHFLLRV